MLLRLLIAEAGKERERAESALRRFCSIIHKFQLYLILLFVESQPDFGKIFQQKRQNEKILYFAQDGDSVFWHTDETVFPPLTHSEIMVF